MLEPDVRHLLLDSLRPPAGYTLEAAVGTTFTLDLLALMAAPVAFAVFDRQREDGSAATDPVSTLQALRAHASNITLFCQAGEISVPPAFRSLLVYLEDSVHPVVPPKAHAIFHPKVWIVRFGDGKGGVAMRLLCLSRNLTFDRSWDTVLRLEGPITDEVLHPELAGFADALVDLANPLRPLAPSRAAQVRALGQQAARVRWEPPAPYQSLRFWPMGHDGVDRDPFGGQFDYPLLISPFVTRDALDRLTRGHRGPRVLISRPESLERLGRKALAHLKETLVLSADAVAPEEEDGDAGPGDRLQGLHAKTYIAYTGSSRAKMWTGSANLTGPGFGDNVEFLVELEGQASKVAADKILPESGKEFGLRKMVEPYVPADEPTQETPEESLAWRLDALKRAIGGLRHQVRCTDLGDGDWRMELTAASVRGHLPVFDGVRVGARPVTLGGSHTEIPAVGDVTVTSAWTVTEDVVTPYIAFEVEAEGKSVGFVVAAELIGGPEDRKERVLSGILKDPVALLRFLLLLLGNVDGAFAMLDGSPGGGERWGDGQAGGEGDAAVLLEPLLRAYARDRDRLADIGRVVDELRKAHGDGVLPPRWSEVWGPIEQAMRQEVGS